MRDPGGERLEVKIAPCVGTLESVEHEHAGGVRHFPHDAAATTTAALNDGKAWSAEIAENGIAAPVEGTETAAFHKSAGGFLEGSDFFAGKLITKADTEEAPLGGTGVHVDLAIKLQGKPIRVAIGMIAVRERQDVAREPKARQAGQTGERTDDVAEDIRPRIAIGKGRGGRDKEARFAEAQGELFSRKKPK